MILALLLPDFRNRTAAGIALGALAVMSALLYGAGLGHVPIHLHHDEIYFGLLSHSLAETGRDPHGRLLPVLFQMGDTFHWYPPVSIYFTALWLKVLPLTDAVVRLPNACVGLLNVALIYFVARRLSDSRPSGLAAAAMLMLTPAHFINSRISTDSLYPVAFILGWLLLLLRYLERPGAARLAAVATVLGLGLYSYIASVVMMPIYLVLTLGVLWRERKPLPAFATALAGFAWPMVFAGLFLTAYPEIIGNYLSKYQLASPGQSLNLFQQVREAATPWNISDHLNLFHSAFAPGYLFVTGSSDLAHSTRLAGVFLAPMAVLMLLGLIAAIRRPSVPATLIVLGFVTAPIASTIVPEAFVIPRMLGLLPFGVLLAVAGVRALWSAPLGSPLRPWPATAGSVLVATGAGYAAVMFIGQSRFSGSAVLMIAAGAALWVTGAACDRRRDWRPVALLLLGLMPVQFAVFAADYFGDYRARSAARYEFNVRGALEQAIRIHDLAPGGPIFINDDILFVRGFWEYYLRVFNRRDLQSRAVWFNSENGLPADVPRGSIIVTNVSERALQRLAIPELVQVADAKDPVPGTAPTLETPTFLIFQKR